MPKEPLPFIICLIFLIGMVAFIVLTFIIGRDEAEYWTRLVGNSAILAVLGIAWLKSLIKG